MDPTLFILPVEDPEVVGLIEEGVFRQFPRFSDQGGLRVRAGEEVLANVGTVGIQIGEVETDPNALASPDPGRLIVTTERVVWAIDASSGGFRRKQSTLVGEVSLGALHAVTFASADLAEIDVWISSDWDRANSTLFKFVLDTAFDAESVASQIVRASWKYRYTNGAQLAEVFKRGGQYGVADRQAIIDLRDDLVTSIEWVPFEDGAGGGVDLSATFVPYDRRADTYDRLAEVLSQEGASNRTGVRSPPPAAEAAEPKQAEPAVSAPDGQAEDVGQEPGWYAAEHTGADERYWDGHGWTDHTRSAIDETSPSPDGKYKPGKLAGPVNLGRNAQTVVGRSKALKQAERGVLIKSSVTDSQLAVAIKTSLNIMPFHKGLLGVYSNCFLRDATVDQWLIGYGAFDPKTMGRVMMDWTFLIDRRGESAVGVLQNGRVISGSLQFGGALQDFLNTLILELRKLDPQTEISLR